MIGAIIGDIAGSTYEFKNHKTSDPYDFALFAPDSHITDDTVCSVAIADALMRAGSEKPDYEDSLVEWCDKYPRKGYGGHFAEWISNPDRKPYNSWGNGSAMRVGGIGYWFDTLEETRAQARASAEPTHNHSEGIKGAESVASAIFLARTGFTPGEIREYLEAEFGYDLHRSIDDIRPTYRFEVSCQKSVPEALICALGARNFEDAVRRGISIGGDSDTIAAIAGSVAQALYGIPNEILARAMEFSEVEFIELAAIFAKAAEARPQPKHRASLI